MADEITPLFAQYLGIKQQHPNEVLFFRLGDFYEMFDDDAVEVSRLLNLTLTHRGQNPMCGIPYHAAKIYIARLLRLGKKIAIAEQVGDIPAPGKGLTERKVIEIITPGTALESEYLDGGINNFLASLCVRGKETGFSFIDVTTGEFKATSFETASIQENFPKELGRCSPRELILPESLRSNRIIQDTVALFDSMAVSYYPDWNFSLDSGYERLTEQFGTANLRSFSLTENSVEVMSAGFLLDYVSKTTNVSSPHIKSIQVYKDSEYVVMDDSSRRNLEITGNLRDGSQQFSLLECVNYTRTAMGSRMMRKWLTFALTDVNAIISRQNHVELFVNDRTLLRRIRDQLDGILDVERLAGRIAMDKAHGKDLQALRASLSCWLNIQSILGDSNFALINPEPAAEIIDLIANSIMEDPATSLTDGGIIKSGWSEELDHWRQVHDNFNQVLDEYVEEEKQATGIQNLKIKKSGNMGYFIEVSKGKLDKVPSHFIMRRTLVNADRYTTEKLQELESNLNESDTRILELERDLFLEVRNRLKAFVAYLQQTAREIAYADVTSSFAEAAVRHNWVRPVIEESLVFDVKGGRHPVVEQHIPQGEFVPNDLNLCSEDGCTFALITGPNMAGKSTFLRQNALISLLAQTGSYVPALYARLGIVDRIFCRVGASDNLAKGESTFLVEMTETAHILRSATEKSLVIMDEVGRGTSTEDGLSIAWAVSEYLLERIKCKTLFATHYHELTRMESDRAKKLCMAVDESTSEVVFLRKVISGSSQNSYGIHVARLAGVPEPVIKRAQMILEKIQGEAEDKPVINADEHVFEEEKSAAAPVSFTGGLFSDEELILDEILSLEVDSITPIQALQTIARWKHSLSGR
ncbi:DNA mismatch repair protein MutS [Treponema rectale]|uniref:DNA mismatch repair protein MutS n=1 Tax=Treponema rectale TaxID=744512 RepID=A0A840SAV8_9SPIR|nr:DNA mismatch repair protein MutS [Treponema rectale]MBB5217935.1 DNA mismatch repair protein MutS [Treponema rectale]QOS40347.1 DNA mismatch repair protein MutS [Treponema rectale]